MKFGKVENPELVDFTLPKTPKETIDLLNKIDKTDDFEVYVGCAKWNKQDLKNFYPPKTKDELTYYSTQFNSIELNATYYRSPTKEVVETWTNKTPNDFKFFPKIPQSISHYGRLQNVTDKLNQYLDAVALFEEKLGMIFLQMHENFAPKDFDKLQNFIENFPKGYPLAVELRHEEWFSNEENFNRLVTLLEEHNISNIIVDTAGRRDMVHMRLTSSEAFVRFVGANIPSDYERLDEWIETIKLWKAEGLEKLYFFIHQNLELESPMLAKYFIKKLNNDLDLDIRGPQDELTLF
ncbi:DUF72 domain-containing protein [Empedobacter falsenii]|uniref:DUF72 domain-containing protein n=1 Tax=Empedobacter falsenii TaxID=343874 RepID=A0ABY8V9Q8_9FLAO|nr:MULTISPECIES: DUF72 domain-containing protein [Empedobacter]MCA4776621.1 DUF72 domain-containing protein [Empedobacter stercoris]MDM1524131.1 DUF72 domain-containing protein [Empedobacter sp. 225-1]MDM1544074.1 DUF72 domain-containing protein [Empedobacter sp. 189-2]WIH97333.1 DUF72 domain-containing protein [Empedobacter falsenii]HJD87608.1 DUF72 domain-containing protein [Empedobacter falsenii]